MPQNPTLLPQMMPGFAPLATGLQPTTFSGMENVPLVGGMGPFGLLGVPVLRNMMGSAGYAPFGMHDVNVYDQIRDMQYTQAQAVAMSQAAARDRENFFRTFRGMAAMSGVQFGAQQRRAAYGLADTATYVAPMMAYMNPDMLESLGGARGSATVMANRMMAAGRYRADPVTGRMGMSAASAGALASNVYGDLYGDDFRQMHGLTAGQAGALFGELQMRGMVAPPDGSVRGRAMLALDQLQRHSPEQLQQVFERTKGAVAPVGDLAKLSGQDLDKLMLDPSVADRMRSLDAEKIKRSLKAYSSAVSAMRDIFGDMGRPNAPMQELMQGLEALTAGSSAWMDPGRLASVTRQTYNLAKQSGMSMDAAMVLQQHAASRADQMGLPPIFAVQAAQGGMGFGGAYRASGQAAHTAWGVFNADQMTQADVNLRVQAAGSHMANRLGAVARLAEAQGGFAVGSQAASLFQAIRTGQTSFLAGGAMRSVVMNDQDLFRIMRDAGVGENTLRDYIDQAGSNRQYVDRYGIGNVVRREQGRAELHPFVRDQMAVALVSSLTGGGLGSDAARHAVGEAAGRVTQRMFGMRTGDFASTSMRTQALADILGDELNGTAAGAMLAGMDPDRRRSFLRTAAEHAYGHTNRVLSSSPYRGLGGLQNIHRLTNEETLAQADVQQQEAAFASRMQESLSPLGRGSPLARAMQFLQDTRPGGETQFRSLIATAFGGVKAADIQPAIVQPLRLLHDRRNELLDLQSALGRTTDNDERARILGQIDKAMTALNAQAGALARVGETYGYYADAAVSKEDTSRGIGAIRAVADSVQDLASIRGNFSTRTTAAEIKGLRGQGGLTHEETAAVLLARRHADKRWTEVTDKDIDEYTARRSHQGIFFGSRDQARQNLLADRRRQIGMFDPDEVEAARASTTIDNDEEARAVAMVRRQMVSPRATEEQIDAMKAQGVPDSLARWAADQEQRARRFGIADEDIRHVVAEHKAGIKQADGSRLPGRDISRAQAIHAIVQGRMMTQYEITDADMALAAGRPDLKGKAPDQVRAILLDERIKDKESRFKTFFASQDAAAFRESVDAAGQFAEDVAVKLVTPAMVQRFGTQALEWNKELRGIQRRQQELAYLHAGGDMAKLEAGFFSGIDLKTAEGRKRELAVIGELDALRQRQMDIFQQLDATHGKAGRQFRLGTVQEGADYLLANRGEFATTPEQQAVLTKHRKWLAAGGSKVDDADGNAVFRDGEEVIRYTRKEFDEVYAPMRQLARERVGDAEEARRLLGLPPGKLNEAQEDLLKKATYAVSVMRRLSPGDVEQFDRWRDSSQALDNMAKRYGVSREDLVAGAKGDRAVARLAVSSPAEVEAHERANVAYRQANRKRIEAADRVKRIEGQLASLVGPEHAETRNQLRKQLDVAKADVAAADKAMQGSLGSVEAAARGKGVDAKEYLLDRVGLVTQRELDHMSASVKAHDELHREATTLATSRGLKKPEDVQDFQNLTAEYEKRRQAATAADTISGMDMVKRLNSTYGLGLDTSTMAADSNVQKAASLLAGAEGRRLIAGLAESQVYLRETSGARKTAVAARLAQLEKEGKGDSEEARRLREHAGELGKGGNAAVDAMLKAYGDAQKGGEAGLKKFREAFGFTGDVDTDPAYRGFTQAADMQLKTQFGRLGEGRSLGIGNLFDLIRNVQMGGEGKEGTKQPGRMEISGTLRLIGDTAEVNAMTGGSMYSVAAQV